MMVAAKKGPSGYYDEARCSLKDFIDVLANTTEKGDVPLASSISRNIPIYDAETVSAHIETPAKRREIMAEWAQVFVKGSGIVVIKGAQPDLAAIDDASAVYERIIADEKAADGAGGDHFAAAGANDRLWNSLQKLCEAAPETFVRYFASPAIDAVCEAWLGPNYQMTAQVNLVHPGGKSQQPHRDYHLGFQTAEQCCEYPAHVHHLSPLMTLQGGIAHCDIPVESGPTKLLPFSQLYRAGYAAWRREDFKAHFEENYVQLPLEKGDALFFNPALFHAAGENSSSDIHRLVNLMQISTAMGRSLEAVNRESMCATVFEALQQAWAAKTITMAQLDAVIASTAEGYPFPTNLDRDPPIGGLAPKSQQELLKEHILNSSDRAAFLAEMNSQRERKNS